MNYFFVIGCPRSGTTVLQQALNRHSRIAIPPETAFAALLGRSRRAQADHIRRINADLEIDLPLPARRISGVANSRAYYERMAELYLDRLQRPQVTHFGEKSPTHQRRLGRLLRLYPQAKAILIYRDGRDVAASLKDLPWMPPDVDLGFALWLHYYRVQRRLQAQFPSNLHLVKYEEFVATPERALRRATAFLGLDYETAMCDGFGNREGVPQWEHGWKSRAFGKVTSSRVGVWRQALSDEEIRRLERWGAGALKSLGYELTAGRTGTLPWMFLPNVYLRAMRWLITRPSFAAIKEICVTADASAANRGQQIAGQTVAARQDTVCFPKRP